MRLLLSKIYHSLGKVRTRQAKHIILKQDETNILIKFHLETSKNTNYNDVTSLIRLKKSIPIGNVTTGGEFGSRALSDPGKTSPGEICNRVCRLGRTQLYCPAAVLRKPQNKLL